MPRTMSRENSVRRRSSSQTSLKKQAEDKEKEQAEKRRLIQEETVEQGSVSCLSDAGCFSVINVLN